MHLSATALLRRGAVLATAFLTVAALAAPAQAAPVYAWVTGVVRGPDGFALQGVVVGQYVYVGPTTPPGRAASTTTDATGAFRLRVFGDAEESFFVGFDAARATGGTSATGYADSCYGSPRCGTPGRGGKLVTAAPGQTIGLGTATLPRATEIRGRVVDALGRGVGRLPVELSNFQRCFPFDADVIVYGATTTDLNGNYVISRVPPVDVTQCLGSAYLYSPDGGVPAADGYDPVSVDYSVPSGRVLVKDFTVQGRGGLAGLVVDQTGAPVRGARVFVDLATPYFTPPQATTTATGRFRVGAVPAGAQRWCVEATGYTGTCDNGASPTVTIRPFRTTGVGTVILRRIS